VKIEPRQVEAFLKKPDPKIRGGGVYGNDMVWSVPTS
jgi:DNA polymerase-3 subunit delta